MEQKQKLFIYDRREIVVLVLLAGMVTLFAFTLGVHLGKRVGHGKSGEVANAPTHALETQGDSVPANQDLSDQSKGAQAAADEALNQSLHEEVARTGIKLDTPRQVELPQKARGTGGATTLEAKREKFVEKAEPRKLAPSEELSQAVQEQAVPAFTRTAPAGKFTLQVGSFPTLDEASRKVSQIDERGAKPFLRSVDIPGKGKWYRIYLGGYASRIEAEKAGQDFLSRQVIDTFIVSKLTDQR